MITQETVVKHVIEQADVAPQLLEMCPCPRDMTPRSVTRNYLEMYALLLIHCTER